MPSEDTINIKIYQYQKSDQVQFIIYADLEYLIEVKTTKVSKHVPSVFSMFSISSFKNIENNHHV